MTKEPDVTIARDIMTREVVTVSPDTSLDELSTLLLEHRISGAPVVDGDGVLVGIVTEKDLIRKNRRLHIPTVVRIFDAFIYLEPSSRFEEELKKMTATRVEEIMTTKVHTVEEESTVEEIATLMSDEGVHVIPVVRDRRVVGIVGKMDLVRTMLGDDAE